MPSVQATLSPFSEGRSLSFPIRPEKDAQGLMLVTTDDAMRKSFDELVRQRLVKSRFRVLADVSSDSSLEKISSRLTTSSADEKKTVVTECVLESGPVACPGFNSLRTAIFQASAKASTSTKTSYKVRSEFAEKGCPLIFDTHFHPRYSVSSSSRSEDASTRHREPRYPPIGVLGMQLFELLLPDPFRTWERLRISAPIPQDWHAVHPTMELDAGARCLADAEDMLG
eukprot:TRINITY_DN34612_c0_g1_i2.p1 TRINITY_DN34612_c0_g1~~TRINITY_DN34612_c0_g1_i2.p1  ORF type:complete len:227 (-),score=32.43 TRINITY_DN34612_c0_g1_i2:230-910(-)